jgi:hypothetical protein
VNTQTRRMGNIALDSLAAICASERCDAESITLLLNSLDPDELVEFTIATIGHAGFILRVAAHAAGCSPDKIAGAVAQRIREES